MGYYSTIGGFLEVKPPLNAHERAFVNDMHRGGRDVPQVTKEIIASLPENEAVAMGNMRGWTCLWAGEDGKYIEGPDDMVKAYHVTEAVVVLFKVLTGRKGKASWLERHAINGSLSLQGDDADDYTEIDVSEDGRIAVCGFERRVTSEYTIDVEVSKGEFSRIEVEGKQYRIG